MKKRFLVALMALALSAAFFPAVAMAAETVSTEEELKAAISRAAGTKDEPSVIWLSKSIQLESTIQIPNGKYIKLNGASREIVLSPAEGFSSTAFSPALIEVGMDETSESLLALKDLVLDGDGKTRGIAIHKAKILNAENLVIRNGFAPDASSGGGIAVSWQSGGGGPQITLSNTEIYNCSAGRQGGAQGKYGGAINTYGGTQICLHNVDFHDNYANWGGSAIYSGEVTLSGRAKLGVRDKGGKIGLLESKVSITGALENASEIYLSRIRTTEEALVTGQDGYRITESDWQKFHLAYVGDNGGNNIADQYTLYVKDNGIYIKQAAVVTFCANDGGDETAVQKIALGIAAELDANSFARPGYIFTGWNTQQDGTGTSYEEGQEVTLAENITLYAQWEEVQVPGMATVPDTAVALDKTELSLEPGQTAKLKATLTPADATYKYIFWTSSDEAVATVTDSGLVTALADGTATVTAKSWYGNEAVCTVTVKTPDEPTPPELVDPWPTEGLAGFVTRCYRVALGRDPDKAGHADWVRWLQEGTVDATSCTYGFVFSKEMNSKNLSDEAFVKTLYSLFMDREGETTGVAFWTSYLQDGHSREEVFYGFADSVEFARLKAGYGIA